MSSRKNMAKREKQLKSAVASKDYCHRNAEEYNQKARERMARKRTEQSEAQSKEAKAIQKDYSRISYICHRDIILDEAQLARQKKHVEQHGAQNEYSPRNVRPCYLLGLRDSTSPQNQRLYEKKVRIWELERKERKAKAEEEKIQARMEKAWANLDEEQLQDWAQKLDAMEAYKCQA
ncbi:hypothetical protein BDP27DRAFT_1510491 [Rhodocollybia butyracea]|uniref:Uncharacterized protein n=1 Tax=Rhodocollybia butyracea TaxID=206335 RepID=A0A9P5PWE8_9AGAR|nr:hypothetical protein BDP27DRAFT_1510491 [Rhodocollybia butyracea]